MEFKKVNFLKDLNKQKISFLFIAPALILFTVFVAFPVFASLFWSFTRYNVVQPAQWVGISNYKNLFLNDPRFWKAVRNTIVYVLTVVPIGICLSLLVAVLIDQKIKFKNFYRTLFFIPTVTSVVAVSVIWKWLLAGGKYGLVNYFLTKFGVQPVDWVMDPRFILPAIMIMSIWGSIGYNMMFFLAGLQTIPKTMYEVADMDGANAWQKFWRITLPLLKPTMIYVVIMSTIVSFQVFEQVYIMTGGTGGGVGGVLDSALTIVAYLYDQGFQKFMMGYASAIAYILFGAIFILTIINFRLIRWRVEY